MTRRRNVSTCLVLSTTGVTQLHAICRRRNLGDTLDARDNDMGADRYGTIAATAAAAAECPSRVWQTARVYAVMMGNSDIAVQ